MHIDRGDPGFNRVATLDIETTHFKAHKGELVSIGIGVHERGDPGVDASYELFHRDGRGEAALIQRAMEQLCTLDADGLVSYNGQGFDLSFIDDRLDILGKASTVPEPPAFVRDQHVDLILDRKQKADRTGVSWPSLEDCLQSYDLPLPKTFWHDEPITNKRFGEEVGPTYLEAISDGANPQDDLVEAINHYLQTDLEANLALYYADIGDSFEFHSLGTEYP
ncbi:hypothetical protein GCM10028857_19590 [Salinarchaeum chitinilyticum]